MLFWRLKNFHSYKNFKHVNKEQQQHFLAFVWFWAMLLLFADALFCSFVSWNKLFLSESELFVNHVLFVCSDREFGGGGSPWGPFVFLIVHQAATSWCWVLHLAAAKPRKITLACSGPQRTLRLRSMCRTGGQIKIHPWVDRFWTEAMENMEQGRHPLATPWSHRWITP